MERLDEQVDRVSSLHRFSLVNALIGLSMTAAIILVSGCSIDRRAERADKLWLESGSISIAKTMPGAMSVPSPSMLGFMPFHLARTDESRLAINTRDNTVTLTSGESSRTMQSQLHLSGLAPGMYKVLLKQKNPLWYAPSSYFSVRGIQTPPEGERSRYLKGALGDFAIFLDKDTAIHNSPVANEEVGGVRLARADIEAVFNSLPVGALVEIQ